VVRQSEFFGNKTGESMRSGSRPGTRRATGHSRSRRIWS